MLVNAASLTRLATWSFQRVCSEVLWDRNLIRQVSGESHRQMLPELISGHFECQSKQGRHQGFNWCGHSKVDQFVRRQAMGFPTLCPRMWGMHAYYPQISCMKEVYSAFLSAMASYMAKYSRVLSVLPQTQEILVFLRQIQIIFSLLVELAFANKCLAPIKAP